MNNKYIDELFKDVMDSVKLSSAMIEVVPMAEGSNMEDFLFETNPPSPDIIPILPMTGNVLFPGTITPINVTRTMSLKLLRYAADKGDYIGVVTQRNELNDTPERSVHTMKNTSLPSFSRYVSPKLLIRMITSAERVSIDLESSYEIKHAMMLSVPSTARTVTSAYEVMYENPSVKFPEDL